MHKPELRELIGLQYLRGVAALAVVIFHFTRLLPFKVDEFVDMCFSAGVDVFFVVSGFIIWKTTERPGLRPWAWMRNRVIRIVPMYYLATIVMGMVYAFAFHDPAPLSNWVTSLLFIPDAHHSRGTFQPILQLGWTLNFEMLFYTVLAASLFLRGRWLRLAMIFGVICVLVAFRPLADPQSPVQFQLTSPLMLEFLAGVTIAVVSPWLARWQYWLGGIALAVGATFLVMVSPHMFPDQPRAIYMGFPAACLVYTVVAFEDVIRLRVIAPLKAMGDASYSTYLSHDLTSMLFALMIPAAANGWFQFGLMVGLSVLSGYAIYRLVEKPMLAWMRGKARA